MLNNKGQSLVMFVVVMPILLLILVLVIDIGRIIVYKQELDNINKIVIDYGLDNFNDDNLEEELVNLIKLNNDNIEGIDIRFEDDKLYMVLSIDVNGIFSGLINKSMFDIESSYVGYIDNGNKRIERMSR